MALLNADSWLKATRADIEVLGMILDRLLWRWRGEKS